MDNEQSEKLLTAMIRLTAAIETLTQRLPQPTGTVECFADGSVREVFSNERNFGDGMIRSDFIGIDCR